MLRIGTDRTVMSSRIARSGGGLQLGGETSLFVAPQDTLQVDFAYDGQEMLVLRAPYASGQTLHLLTQSRLSATR